MKHHFISAKKNQYRANLHCHSTLSDGRLTPQELKDAYKNEGYSVLAITDHEAPKNHSNMTEPDFLMLTGYEAYIRNNKGGWSDNYAPEIHLNLFAKEPSNESFVCFNDKYCKYIKDPVLKDALKKVGSDRPREYTVEYINEFIQTAIDNGYLISYNHPVWSMEDEERIFSYKNFFSLEIDNFSSWQLNGLEHSGALYDKLLSRGVRCFCHGGDDNHNVHPLNDVYSDSFGAYTMILADRLTYSAVIEAMEQGEMYSSTGPRINEIYIDEEVIHIETSPASRIIVFDGGKSPKRLLADRGELITSADIPLSSKAKFFRVAVIDEKGKIASSRGYFRDEWESQK